jgi:ketosteroid isomerase-like protein
VPTTTRLTDPAALDEFCLTYLAAVNSNDPERTTALLTEDVVWYDVALTEPLHGRAAVAAFLGGIYDVVSGLRVVEPDPPHRSVSQDGTAVAWGWVTLGTMVVPDSGGQTRELDLPGVDLWRVREDGLISEYRGYYDLKLMGLPEG